MRVYLVPHTSGSSVTSLEGTIWLLVGPVTHIYPLRIPRSLRCLFPPFSLQVVGSQARILYSDQKGRVAIAVAFNQAIARGKIKVTHSVLQAGSFPWAPALGCWHCPEALGSVFMSGGRQITGDLQ